MKAQIRPQTTGGLAAEVQLPATAEAERGTPRLVQDALHTFGVVVLRGLALTHERYTQFVSQFGTMELVVPRQHAAPCSPYIRLQSSVPGTGVAGGGEYWHADGPLTQPPTALTFLLCEVAPSSGGYTWFADMRQAFDQLDPIEAADLADKWGIYPCREIASRELSAAGVPDAERERQMAELSDLRHPIVRLHPLTGRPALYLNQQWLTSIDGESDDKLLKDLYRRAVQPQNTYCHTWQPGDILVWDNAAVMHRAEAPAEGASKTTCRITIAGAGYRLLPDYIK